MERQPKYQLSQPRNPFQTSSPFFIEVDQTKEDRNNLSENERHTNKLPSDDNNSNRFENIQLQPSNKSKSPQSNEKQDKEKSPQQTTTSQNTKPKTKTSGHQSSHRYRGSNDFCGSGSFHCCCFFNCGDCGDCDCDCDD